MRQIYTGQLLAEDEYLLKIKKDGTGFLTKLTKKNEIPKKFDDWGKIYAYKGTTVPEISETPIYVHQEKVAEGWELVRWRIGQSQEWATIKHPEGFTVEIYLRNFLQIVKENTIVNGRIQGAFKWEENKLVK